MCQPDRSGVIHTLPHLEAWQDRPQLDEVKEWWKSGDSGVCTLVGNGGEGKTAIVARFLSELPGAPRRKSIVKDAQLRPPAGLFVFSYYEDPNPDLLLRHLLAWLTEREPEEVESVRTFADLARPLRKRINELALNTRVPEGRSVQKHDAPGNLLIVVDNFEGVQKKLTDDVPGEVINSHLAKFVDDLAEDLFPGVSLLITTRYTLPSRLGNAGLFCQQINVDELPPDLAVQLLRKRGVARGHDTRLRALAAANGNHALALNLLGGFIALFCDGDPSQLGEAPLTEFTEREGAETLHLEQIIDRYDQDLSLTERALLQRVCVFRRELTEETLLDVFTKIVNGKREIFGSKIGLLSPSEIQDAIGRLRTMQVVNYDDESRLYSVHPVIRKGFEARMDDKEAAICHEILIRHTETRLGVTVKELFELPDRKMWKSDITPDERDLGEELIRHLLKLQRWQFAYSVYSGVMGGYSNLARKLSEVTRGERVTSLLLAALPDTPSWETARLINTRGGFCRDLGYVVSSLEHYNRARGVADQLGGALARRESWVSKRSSVRSEILMGQLEKARDHATTFLNQQRQSIDEDPDAQAEEAQLCLEIWQAKAEGFLGDTDGAMRKLETLHNQLRDYRDNHEKDHRFMPYVAISFAELRDHARSFSSKVRKDILKTADQIIKKEGVDWGSEHWYFVIAAARLCVADKKIKRGCQKYLLAFEQWINRFDVELARVHFLITNIKLDISKWQREQASTCDESRLLELNDEAIGLSDEAIRATRRAGLGIYHIDALLLRAQLSLQQGDASGAQRYATEALNGIQSDPDSRFPTLPGASQIGYGWGKSRGRTILDKVPDGVVGEVISEGDPVIVSPVSPKRHVFLSYCRENKEEVSQLRADLMKRGETVWWDQDILAGSGWKEEIRKAIGEAYAFVLCLSNKTANRVTSGIYPEVDEAIEAYRQYKPGAIFIIPVRLSECEIPAIPIGNLRELKHLQRADLFPQRDEGLKKLIKSLREAPLHPRHGVAAT